MSETHKLIPIMLILFCLAGVAWMVITNHAVANHTTEAWNSMRVLEAFRKHDGKDCDRLEVAACTRQNEKDGFTVRAYCELNGRGIYGVWGWSKNQGIYVTGYAVDYARWLAVCKRDGCVEGDVTLLARVLK